MPAQPVAAGSLVGFCNAVIRICVAVGMGIHGCKGWFLHAGYLPGTYTAEGSGLNF